MEPQHIVLEEEVLPDKQEVLLPEGMVEEEPRMLVLEMEHRTQEVELHLD
jgi:hypothetical protein